MCANPTIAGEFCRSLKGGSILAHWIFHPLKRESAVQSVHRPMGSPPLRIVKSGASSARPMTLPHDACSGGALGERLLRSSDRADAAVVALSKRRFASRGASEESAPEGGRDVKT
jgi:hypothetical protein